jgi:ribosomal protein S30
MPKIQAEEKIKTTPFTVKVREDWQKKIEAYCHYLNPETPSSPGYVLTECFKQVAEKDPEFAAFFNSFTPKVGAKSKARNGKAQDGKA